MYAAVAVTVVHALLFCCMCGRVRGDGNAGGGSGGGLVAVRAYMAGTHGLGVLSSVGGVLEMSLVRGVCGVWDMCLCFGCGGVGGVGRSGCAAWARV